MTIPDHLHWIDGWLYKWAVWARRDKSEIERMCGYRSNSSGFESGGSSSAEAIDHITDDDELRCIRIVDGAVRSLPGQYWSAVCNHYLAKVAKHRGDPTTILLTAMAEIEATAVRKGLVKVVERPRTSGRVYRVLRGVGA